MSTDDEKALIAAIRATPTFGDETRNELLGLALQAADALEARVHPTVTDAEVEAGAIAAYVIDYPFRSMDGWTKTHPANRENYRTLARAALEAARAVEPNTNPKED